MEFVYHDEIKNVNTDKTILTFHIVKYYAIAFMNDFNIYMLYD